MPRKKKTSRTLYQRITNLPKKKPQIVITKTPNFLKGKKPGFFGEGAFNATKARFADSVIGSKTIKKKKKK